MQLSTKTIYGIRTIIFSTRKSVFIHKKNKNNNIIIVKRIHQSMIVKIWLKIKFFLLSLYL